MKLPNGGDRLKQRLKWWLAVSLAVNIGLVILIGLLVHSSYTFRGLNYNGVADTAPILIENAQLDYRQEYSNNSLKLKSATDKLLTAGGELQAFGYVENNQDFIQLGIVCGDIAMGIWNNQNVKANIQRLDIIREYLPTDSDSLKRLSHDESYFDKQVSNALRNLAKLSPLGIYY